MYNTSSFLYAVCGMRLSSGTVDIEGLSGSAISRMVAVLVAMVFAYETQAQDITPVLVDTLTADSAFLVKRQESKDFLSGWVQSPAYRAKLSALYPEKSHDEIQSIIDYIDTRIDMDKEKIFSDQQTLQQYYYTNNPPEPNRPAPIVHGLFVPRVDSIYLHKDIDMYMYLHEKVHQSSMDKMFIKAIYDIVDVYDLLSAYYFIPHQGRSSIKQGKLLSLNSGNNSKGRRFFTCVLFVLLVFVLYFCLQSLYNEI